MGSVAIKFYDRESRVIGLPTESEGENRRILLAVGRPSSPSRK